MNELYFLTEAAQDALNRIVDQIEGNQIIRALTTMGELRYILDIMAIEQEKTATEDHNGQCRH